MKLKLFFQYTLLVLVFSINAYSQTNQIKYTQMTETEKNQFIESETNKFLGLFRTVGDYKIDEAGVARVKVFINSYLQKKNSAKTPSDKCKFKDDLVTILQRGKLSAPDINSAFTSQEIPSQIGLYIAMIETEFCPCLQAPTGTLGMFQLTFNTATLYGINAVKGATSQKPDNRCKTKLAAAGAAAYLKKMLNTDFGNNAIGVAFAVSAYNAGEGITKKLISLTNLQKKDPFSYWEMKNFNFNSIEEDNSNKNAILQFQNEGFKYFPKFLAAMIIGENPRAFGIEMNPLSQN